MFDCVEPKVYIQPMITETSSWTSWICRNVLKTLQVVHVNLPSSQDNFLHCHEWMSVWVRGWCQMMVGYLPLSKPSIRNGTKHTVSDLTILQRRHNQQDVNIDWFILLWWLYELFYTSEGLLISLQTQNLTHSLKTSQKLAGLLRNFEVVSHRYSLQYTTEPYAEITKANELPPRTPPRYWE
jgi:hypothetical protein